MEMSHQVNSETSVSNVGSSSLGYQSGKEEHKQACFRCKTCHKVFLGNIPAEYILQHMKEHGITERSKGGKRTVSELSANSSEENLTEDGLIGEVLDKSVHMSRLNSFENLVSYEKTCKVEPGIVPGEVSDISDTYFFRGNTPTDTKPSGFETTDRDFNWKSETHQVESPSTESHCNVNTCLKTHSVLIPASVTVSEADVSSASETNPAVDTFLIVQSFGRHDPTAGTNIDVIPTLTAGEVLLDKASFAKYQLEQKQHEENLGPVTNVSTFHESLPISDLSVIEDIRMNQEAQKSTEYSTQLYTDSQTPEIGSTNVQNNDSSVEDCFRCEVCGEVFLEDATARYILCHMSKHSLVKPVRARSSGDKSTTRQEQDEDIAGNILSQNDNSSSVTSSDMTTFTTHSDPSNNSRNTSKVKVNVVSHLEDSIFEPIFIKRKRGRPKKKGFKGFAGRGRAQLRTRHEEDVDSDGDISKTDDKSSSVTTFMTACSDTKNMSQMKENVPSQPEVVPVNKDSLSNSLLDCEFSCDGEPFSNIDNSTDILPGSDSDCNGEPFRDNSSDVLSRCDAEPLHKDSVLQPKVKKRKVGRPKKKGFAGRVSDQPGTRQEQHVDSDGDIFSQKDEKVSPVTSSDVTTFLTGQSCVKNISQMEKNVVSRQNVVCVNKDSLSTSLLDCEFSSDAEPLSDTDNVADILPRLDSDCNEESLGKDLLLQYVQPKIKKRKVGRPKKKGFAGRRRGQPVNISEQDMKIESGSNNEVGVNPSFCSELKPVMKDSILREQLDHESDISSLSASVIPQPNCKVVLASIQPDKSSVVNSDINFETSVSETQSCNRVISGLKIRSAVSHEQIINTEVTVNAAHCVDDDKDDKCDDIKTIRRRSPGQIDVVNSGKHHQTSPKRKSERESVDVSSNENSFSFTAKKQDGQNQEGSCNADTVVRTETEHGKISGSLNSASAVEKRENRHLDKKCYLSKGNNAKGNRTKCNICGKELTTSYIQYHIDTYHKFIKCNPCDVCGKSFRSEGKLNAHKRVHTGEKPFKCNKCSSTFALKQYLRRHLDTHEVTWDCETCAYSCDSYLKLVYHRNEHYNGELFGPCEYCGATFRSRGSLAHHLSHQHPGHLAYNCETCGEMFSTIETYRQHRSRPCITVYECDKCDKTFKHKKSLQIHLLRHANIYNYCCDQCGKRFVSHGQFRGHVKLVHKNIKRKGNVLCEICSYRTFTMKELREHMERRHSDSKNYKCHCGKCFAVESALKIHMRIHTGETPYKCRLCDKAFSRRSSLFDHQIAHKVTNVHKCKLCGKEFQSRSIYQQHKAVHSDERRFKCPVCNFAFKRAHALKVHMSVHSEETPYKCTQCGKGMRSTTALRQHKAWHEKVERRKASRAKSPKSQYKCHCGKCFAEESHLKIHMRLHTGEMPYKCNLCDRAYSRRSSLYKHKVTHMEAKVYQCKLCGKELRGYTSYNRHKTVHSDEKRFKCTLCNSAYKRSNALWVHMRVHTGEKPYKCTQCGKGLGSSKALRKHKAWHEKVERRKASQAKSSKFEPKSSKSRDKSTVPQSKFPKNQLKASNSKTKAKSSPQKSLNT